MHTAIYLVPKKGNPYQITFSVNFILVPNVPNLINRRSQYMTLLSIIHTSQFVHVLYYTTRWIICSGQTWCMFWNAYLYDIYVCALMWVQTHYWFSSILGYCKQAHIKYRCLVAVLNHSTHFIAVILVQSFPHSVSALTKNRIQFVPNVWWILCNSMDSIASS